MQEAFRFCPACGAAADSPTDASDPLIGRTIAGAYAIRELVGVGGMGRVYRAEQVTLGRSVALKVISPHLLTDEQAVARFYREARAASALGGDAALAASAAEQLAALDAGREPSLGLDLLRSETLRPP